VLSGTSATAGAAVAIRASAATLPRTIFRIDASTVVGPSFALC